MASKKPEPAPAKKPAKRPSSTQLNKHDAEFARIAAEDASIEASTGLGSFFGTRGGVLTFNNAEIPDNEMNVVVLGHIMENHWYTERFDPNNPVSPACFAFGKTLDEMAPHENSAQPQHASCQGCPMNEFGSAEQGAGKACGNIRRLALIPEADVEDVERAEAAELAFLKVPVMSVKGWAGYVRQITETMRKPMFAVVTRVWLTRDERSQFRVNFQFVRELDDPAVLQALLARRETVDQALRQPYQPYEERETKKPARAPNAKLAGRGRQAPPPPATGKGKAAPARAKR